MSRRNLSKICKQRGLRLLKREFTHAHRYILFNPQNDVVIGGFNKLAQVRSFLEI